MILLKKIGNAVSTLVMIVMIFLAVMLVGVRLIGLTPYAVLSGSMEPTYHVGSLIYVEKIDPADIRIGTPITFVVNEDLVLATHRVVGVEVYTTKQVELLDESGNPLLDENGQPRYEEVPLEEPTYYFQTKGDANEAVDGAAVHYKNVVGTPKFSIPYLGYLSNWLQTPKGMIMGASIALVILILTFIPDLLNLVDDEPVQKEKKEKKPKKEKKKKPEKKKKRRDEEDDDEEDMPQPTPQPVAEPKPAAPAPAPQPPQPIARPAAIPTTPEAPSAPAAPAAAEPSQDPAELNATDAPPRRRRRRQVIEQETEE